MHRPTILSLILAACASTPHSERVEHELFEGHAVAAVREAAKFVVEEIAHPMSVIRVTKEGGVLTEGWIGDCAREVACAGPVGFQGIGPRQTPWATIEVRFHGLGTGTAVEVETTFEDCQPAVSCQPLLLASTGALERRIVDDIRSRLESPEAPGLVLP